jgi:hypothetical protein
MKQQILYSTYSISRHSPENKKVEQIFEHNKKKRIYFYGEMTNLLLIKSDAISEKKRAMLSDISITK